MMTSFNPHCINRTGDICQECATENLCLELARRGAVMDMARTEAERMLRKLEDGRAVVAMLEPHEAILRMIIEGADGE